MVLHKPDVGNHHIKNIFTHCLDVTAQLQLLAIQQHHTNLPLHFLHLTTFLVGREKKKDGVINGTWSSFCDNTMDTLARKFITSPLLKREQIRQHRAHWPSSQTQAHGSSVVGVKTKHSCQRENGCFTKMLKRIILNVSLLFIHLFGIMTTDCV